MTFILFVDMLNDPTSFFYTEDTWANGLKFTGIMFGMSLFNSLLVTRAFFSSACKNHKNSYIQIGG